MAARTTSRGLPPRMYRKKGKKTDGTEWVTYYHICKDPVTNDRTETSLGKDYEKALVAYRKIESDNASKVALMKHAFDKYMADVLPKLSERSQRDASWTIKKLRSVFNNAPIDAVTPAVVAKYRDKRSVNAPVRANREMAFLSTVFNYAREWGMTEKENPCRGVRKNKEKPRDFYADDETFNAVYEHANPELKNAMDLAYLTGQRPADVLNFKFSQVVGDCLQLEQAKTGKRLNILLAGEDGPNELGKVIERIMEQGVKERSKYLVCNRDGYPLNTQTLRMRFNRAKKMALVDADEELAEKIKQFQFRDIRPKAASEMPLELASALLGHTKEEITKKVYQRKGATVAPTR